MDQRVKQYAEFLHNRRQAKVKKDLAPAAAFLVKGSLDPNNPVFIMMCFIALRSIIAYFSSFTWTLVYITAQVIFILLWIRCCSFLWSEVIFAFPCLRRVGVSVVNYSVQVKLFTLATNSKPLFIRLSRDTVVHMLVDQCNVRTGWEWSYKTVTQVFHGYLSRRVWVEKQQN